MRTQAVLLFVVSSLISVYAAKTSETIQGNVIAGDFGSSGGEFMILSDMKSLACEVSQASPLFTMQIAGINLASHPRSCGSCVTISCASPDSCASSFTNLTAAVVDDCRSQGCSSTTIKLSSFAFRSLTGLPADQNLIIPVVWTLTDCNPSDGDVVTKEQNIIGSGKLEAGVAAETAGKLQLKPDIITEQPLKQSNLDDTVVEMSANQTETPVGSIAAASTPEVEEIMNVAPESPAPEEEAPVPVPTEVILNPPTNSPTVTTFSATATLFAAEYTTNNMLTNESLKKLACEFGPISNDFRTHFAGARRYQWKKQQQQPACGTCLKIACSNKDQCPNGGETIVQVVDDCGGSCVTANDLSISPVAMKEITGSDQLTATVEVGWSLTDCRPKISGEMYMKVADDSNDWYTAMTFSNSIEPVTKVSINGEELHFMDDSRWVWNRQGKTLQEVVPVELEVFTGSDSSSSGASLLVKKTLNELKSGFVGK